MSERPSLFHIVLARLRLAWPRFCARFLGSA